MSHMISRLSDWSSLSSPLAPLDGTALDLITELGEEVKTRPAPAHLAPTPALLSRREGIETGQYSDTARD